MTAARKIRIVSAALLALMVTLAARGRSADVPVRKALLTHSEQSELMPQSASRLLSRQEIYQAIQSDLARRTTSTRGDLRPDDLRIQSSVPVLNSEMGLEVKKVSFDPIRRETVFQLWASQEPQYLPFEVTTRRDPRSLGIDQLWAGSRVEADKGDSGTKGRNTGGAAYKPLVLAKPGSLATLIMLSQNVRITTSVVPLQPGTKGQRILVRDLTTSAVRSAEVVGEGLLQTSF
jgi:hypothetical protein